MKIAELLSGRQKQWRELDQLCAKLEARASSLRDGETATRFASLYRAACADLALADSYHLPPNTVKFLHQLVGRAHNQLYRSRSFHFQAWAELLFRDVPQQIFSDRCVLLAACLFWGGFLLAALMALNPQSDFVVNAIGESKMARMEEDFKDPIAGRDYLENQLMATFYIKHNTGIGLSCFSGGLLILPGLVITMTNAAILGASFGYMARPDVASGVNFFHFVTAHGPFELTAIVLSAGSGLRLGMSWLSTKGLTRVDSLRKTANESMPMMGAAIALFFLAALIEGFLSPSALPYEAKAAVAIISSSLLMFYFVVLGYPVESSRGA